MELDRRGGVAWGNGASNRKREGPVQISKPFDITKREVWEAYKKVKANQGAAGINGQTIEMFEQDLRGISTSYGTDWRPGVINHRQSSA